MARETKSEKIAKIIAQWNAYDKPAIETLPAGRVDAKALIKALKSIRIKSTANFITEDAARAQLVRITADTDNTLTLTTQDRYSVDNDVVVGNVIKMMPTLNTVTIDNDAQVRISRAGTVIIDVQTLIQWLELAENKFIEFQPESREVSYMTDVQLRANYSIKSLERRHEAHLCIVDGRARSFWRAFPDSVIAGAPEFVAVEVETAPGAETVTTHADIVAQHEYACAAADILHNMHERVEHVKETDALRAITRARGFASQLDVEIVTQWEEREAARRDIAIAVRTHRDICERMWRREVDKIAGAALQRFTAVIDKALHVSTAKNGRALVHMADGIARIGIDRAIRAGVIVKQDGAYTLVIGIRGDRRQELARINGGRPWQDVASLIQDRVSQFA